MKKRIRLNESDLYKIVSKTVNEAMKLNEVGETSRGQYMLGRVDARATDKHIASMENGDEDIDARNDSNNAFDSWAQPRRADGKIDYENDPYTKGMDDQRKGDFRRIQNNYDVYNMQDTEKLQREFITFVEKNGLETVYDYESGNMGGGQRVSPAPALVQSFEENLGYDLSPEKKTALKNAYNQWWYYAQSQFDFGDDEMANENKQYNTRHNMRRTITLSESDLHNIIRRAVNEVINGQVGGFGSQYYNDVTGSHGEGDMMTSVRDDGKGNRTERTFDLHKPRNFNLEKGK